MRRVGLIALVFLLAAFGCQKAPSIVGSWQGRNGQLEVDLVFQEGGNFSMNITGPNRQTEMMLNVEQKGTYVFVPSDKSLKLTFTEVKVKGVQEGMAKTMEEGIIKKNNEEGASKVEMPDANTLKITGSEGTTTFTRKKS